MNGAGWLAAGLAVAALALVWAARHRTAPGQHGGAGAAATPARLLIERCHAESLPARPPLRLSWSGDLSDALADEPTRVLPRVAPDPLPSSYSRDRETLRRLLDALHRL
ncbi:hypothetical protein [Saccharopolyspora cebuensis]|uniref:Uncharacterized protein n=1 Tax=Saccharopolyspora cebuensis TaxID=418759 RepID=A0ABV4CLF1_9PSEU